MKIEFTNAAEVAAALSRLAERVEDLTPVMREIGEYLAEATRQRFTRGAGPDGRPWAPNRPATLARYGARFGAKSRTARVANKRPLIGETKQLSQQIHYQASRQSVEVGSSRVAFPTR